MAVGFLSRIYLHLINHLFLLQGKKTVRMPRGNPSEVQPRGEEEERGHRKEERGGEEDRREDREGEGGAQG